MNLNLTDPTLFTSCETVPIRYSDQDAMGHVNNVAYAAFFEAGRMGLFKNLLAGHGDLEKNFVLAHVSIDYLREIHFPGDIQVYGRLLKVGGKSITTGYGAFLGDTCCATSVSVNVFFDPETRKSAPFPDALANAFRSQLVP
ncbi:MAG: acyl-CoA thioesterase [Pikeienuella sp.]